MIQDYNPELLCFVIVCDDSVLYVKVGAAISRTHTTGEPILFVGTGQTYADLNTLNAQSLMSDLLS